MPETSAENKSLYDTLNRRGLVAQCTDENIRKRLSKPLTAYVGFDPTADSLHVGSLVPIMGLAHLQRAGHKPLALVGGATGLVGDPSGKTESRQMLGGEQITHNASCIKNQIAKIVRFDDSPTGGKLVNNADWLAGKNWIEMLREIGPHFSVNRMLSMDSVKSRMALSTSSNADGISFLEFNYMVMQAYDFVHLNRTYGCTLQMGGQDQWGNIVMGIELGRRLDGVDLGGLTFPLVTKADGGKFGKSETGNVWLDSARTSPYDFYQFWRNVADSDVKKFLGYFTFLPFEEITQLTKESGAALNQAKQRLAFEVTKLIHGQDEAQKAQDSAAGAFSSQRDVTGESVPAAQIPAGDLGGGILLTTLLKDARLCQSNSEARRLIKGGGVRIGDEKITDINYVVTEKDVSNSYILIRAGKKRMFRFDIQN